MLSRGGICTGWYTETAWTALPDPETCCTSSAGTGVRVSYCHFTSTDHAFSFQQLSGAWWNVPKALIWAHVLIHLWETAYGSGNYLPYICSYVTGLASNRSNYPILITIKLFELNLVLVECLSPSGALSNGFCIVKTPLFSAVCFFCLEMCRLSCCDLISTSPRALCPGLCFRSL